MREQATAAAGFRAGNQSREAGGRHLPRERWVLRKNNKLPSTGKVEKDEERQLWGSRALLPARRPPAASPQAGQGDRYLGPAEATAGAKGRGGPTSAAPGEAGAVPRPYCRRALPRPVAMAGSATAGQRLRAGPGRCRLPPDTAQPGEGKATGGNSCSPLISVSLTRRERAPPAPRQGWEQASDAPAGRTRAGLAAAGGVTAAPCRDSRPVSFTPPGAPSPAAGGLPPREGGLRRRRSAWRSL